ncbi:unnamed protein product [Neospora caninum Liverpool]|nr:uncharacterized protein NCLIV_019060 [Neospora caninum Liverpool]CBZ52117.1 unnamed protein product [Neospora caninum Liverpool]|eukprot:XP_003882149.1 uncharacterized protein NCLIV_019060 [Neospora caninum Liverpool]
MPPQTLSDCLARVPSSGGQSVWESAGREERVAPLEHLADAVAPMPSHAHCSLRGDAIAAHELWSGGFGSRCKVGDSFAAPPTSVNPFRPTMTRSGASDVTASTTVSSRASQASSFEWCPSSTACEPASACPTQDEEINSTLSPSPSPCNLLQFDLSSSATAFTCRESSLPVGASQPPGLTANALPPALVKRAAAAKQKATPEPLKSTLPHVSQIDGVSYTAPFECTSSIGATNAVSAAAAAVSPVSDEEHDLHLVPLSPSCQTQGHLQVHRSYATPCLPSTSRMGEFGSPGFPQEKTDPGVPWGLERYCYPELCTPTVAGSEEPLHFASCHPESFGLLQGSSRCIDAFCCGACSTDAVDQCAGLCGGASQRRPAVRREAGQVPLTHSADSSISRDFHRLPGFKTAGAPERDPSLFPGAPRGGKDLPVDDGGDSLCNPYQELQNLTEGSPLHERAGALFPYLRLETETPGYSSPYKYQALDSPSSYKWKTLTTSPRESRLSRSISPSTWDGLSIYLSESDAFYQDMSLQSSGDTPSSPLVRRSGVSRLLTSDDPIGEPLTPTDVSPGGPSRLSTRSELVHTESSQLATPNLPLCAGSPAPPSEELRSLADTDRPGAALPVPVGHPSYQFATVTPEAVSSSTAKRGLEASAWWEENSTGQQRLPEQSRCLPEGTCGDAAASSRSQKGNGSSCPAENPCISGSPDAAATRDSISSGVPGTASCHSACQDSYVSGECSEGKGAGDCKAEGGIPTASCSSGQGFAAIPQSDTTGSAEGTANACHVGTLASVAPPGTAPHSISTACSSLSSESGAAAPTPFPAVRTERQDSAGTMSPVSCSGFSPATIASCHGGNGSNLGLPSIPAGTSCFSALAHSAALPANKSAVPCGDGESYQTFAQAANYSSLVRASHLSSTGAAAWSFVRGMPGSVASKPAVAAGLIRCASSFVASVPVTQQRTQPAPSVPPCSPENFAVRPQPFVTPRTTGDGQLPRQPAVLQQSMPQIAKAPAAGKAWAPTEVSIQQGVSTPPQFCPTRAPLNGVGASSNLLAATGASHADCTNLSAMKYPYFCPPAAHLGRPTGAPPFGNVSCLAKDEPPTFEEHEHGETQRETTFDFGGPTAVPIRTRKGFRKPLPLPQEMLACPGDVGDAERGNEPVLQYDAASREWRVFWVEDRLARYKVFQAKKFGKERAQQLAEDWYHRARAGHVSVGSRGLRGVQSQGAPKAKKIKTEA